MNGIDIGVIVCPYSLSVSEGIVVTVNKHFDGVVSELNTIPII